MFNRRIMFMRLNRTKITIEKEPSEENEQRPSIRSSVSARWKMIGHSIREHRSKILRKSQNKAAETEVWINDEEFARAMIELQASGVKTNIGAAEFLHRMSLERKSNEVTIDVVPNAKAKLHKKSRLELFDKKQSFRHVVAMSVTESSKKPIYRRTSDVQMRALERVSIEELDDVNMYEQIIEDDELIFNHIETSISSNMENDKSKINEESVENRFSRIGDDLIVDFKIVYE